MTNDVSTLVYDSLPEYSLDYKDATRNISGNLLKLLNKSIPNLVGGSADVAASVKTGLPDEIDYSSEHYEGRNINFGIREFAMAAIQNGILLHGGLRTYVGCFLVFSDYLKPAVRMAAMSKLPAIYLFSHDSIAVGEDGPTHQPIEQLAMLRSIPNMDVIRPCDGKETAAGWKLALESLDHPTALILSRQNLPTVSTTSYEGVKCGGYIVSPEEKQLDFVIVASGSEVGLVLEAQKLLWKEGIDTRVVSMPSLNRFLQQNYKYQENVLGPSYERRISVEMLSTFGWHVISKNVMGIETFGASGPAEKVMEKFNFTAEALAKRISAILDNLK